MFSVKVLLLVLLFFFFPVDGAISVHRYTHQGYHMVAINDYVIKNRETVLHTSVENDVCACRKRCMDVDINPRTDIKTCRTFSTIPQPAGGVRCLISYHGFSESQGEPKEGARIHLVLEGGKAIEFFPHTNGLFYNAPKRELSLEECRTKCQGDHPDVKNLAVAYTKEQLKVLAAFVRTPEGANTEVFKLRIDLTSGQDLVGWGSSGKTYDSIDLVGGLPVDYPTQIIPDTTQSYTLKPTLEADILTGVAVFEGVDEEAQYRCLCIYNPLLVDQTTASAIVTTVMI